MGRGDRRSKKGKIFHGSFGVSRPARKKSTAKSNAVVTSEKKVKPATAKKAPKKKAKE